MLNPSTTAHLTVSVNSSLTLTTFSTGLPLTDHPSGYLLKLRPQVPFLR